MQITISGHEYSLTANGFGRHDSDAQAAIGMAIDAIRDWHANAGDDTIPTVEALAEIGDTTARKTASAIGWQTIPDDLSVEIVAL